MCKRIFQTRWLVGCLLLCNLLLGCHDMLTCSGFFLIHSDSENKVNNGMADVNFCFHQFVSTLLWEFYNRELLFVFTIHYLYTSLFRRVLLFYFWLILFLLQWSLWKLKVRYFEKEEKLFLPGFIIFRKKKFLKIFQRLK